MVCQAEGTALASMSDIVIPPPMICPSSPGMSRDWSRNISRYGPFRLHSIRVRIWSPGGIQPCGASLNKYLHIPEPIPIWCVGVSPVAGALKPSSLLLLLHMEPEPLDQVDGGLPFSLWETT